MIVEIEAYTLETSKLLAYGINSWYDCNFSFTALL